jgi:hypothetical protein
LLTVLHERAAFGIDFVDCEATEGVHSSSTRTVKTSNEVNKPLHLPGGLSAT